MTPSANQQLLMLVTSTFAAHIAKNEVKVKPLYDNSGISLTFTAESIGGERAYVISADEELDTFDVSSSAWFQPGIDDWKQVVSEIYANYIGHWTQGLADKPSRTFKLYLRPKELVEDSKIVAAWQGSVDLDYVFVHEGAGRTFEMAILRDNFASYQELKPQDRQSAWIPPRGVPLDSKAPFATLKSAGETFTFVHAPPTLLTELRMPFFPAAKGYRHLPPEVQRPPVIMNRLDIPGTDHVARLEHIQGDTYALRLKNGMLPQTIYFQESDPASKFLFNAGSHFFLIELTK